MHCALAELGFGGRHFGKGIARDFFCLSLHFSSIYIPREMRDVGVWQIDLTLQRFIPYEDALVIIKLVL